MTHASLFSGIGGFDYAAALLGWINIFDCEIDAFCRKVLEYHFPNSVHYGDITKQIFKEWRGKIDVLSGGFPCQPFSLAGQRKGADDNRYLWPQMLRVIREIRPTWVVGENVAGILTMVQPGAEVEVGGRPLYSERITEKEYCTDKNMLSKPFVETLSVKDMPSNRYLFRLVPSERRTEGIEFGLLPTVQTQGLKRCNSQGKTEFMPLELLPTPMATDIHHAERVAELKKRGAKGLRCRDKGEAGANGLTDWMDFHGMLPTPTARDYNGSASMESIQRRKRNHLTNNLSDVYAQRGKTSQLNPRFVSEMMGFPVDWTVLPFLNGGKNP